MLLRLVLPAALVALRLCGQPDDLTAQMTNGKGWEAMSADARVFYVAAIRDLLAREAILGSKQDRWAEGFTVSDYVKEITALYKDRENILIPVPFLFDHCTFKLRGKLTKEELEKLLMTQRRFAATLKKL